MNAKFGVISKPMNSTSRAMSNDVTLSCKLKEPCGRHDPVFIVKGLNKLTRYNYCEWEDGYYWIDDIIYKTRDIQEVHCSLDPMATFRDDIGNVTGFCIYSDESHWHQFIDDHRFVPDQIVFRQSSYGQFFNNLDHFWQWTNLSESTVILDVIEVTPSSGFKKYAMSYNVFCNVIYNLNANTLDNAAGTFKGSHAWQEIATQAGQDLCAIIGALGGSASWQDCVIKATWLPIHYHYFGQISHGVVNSLRIGTIPINLGQENAYLLTNYPFYVIQDNISMPRHAIFGSNQIMDDLEFLKNSRWCQIQIASPAGIQVIIDDMIRNEDIFPLKCYCDLDMISGKWKIYVTTYDSTLGQDNSKLCQKLAEFSGTIAADLTYLLSNKGNGALVVGQASAKISAAILTGGTSMVTESVTDSIRTNKKDVVNNETYTPLMTSKGNPSTYGASTSENRDNSVITTEAHTVTTGKKMVPVPSINSGMREFNSVADDYLDYWFASSGGSLPFLGLSVHAIGWGPIAFINDADPYEAYKDYCDDYGYPCHDYISVSDCTNNSYLQFNNTFLHSISGATYEDIKTINFFLNDGFIWYQEIPTP